MQEGYIQKNRGNTHRCHRSKSKSAKALEIKIVLWGWVSSRYKELQLCRVPQRTSCDVVVSSRAGPSPEEEPRPEKKNRFVYDMFGSKETFEYLLYTLTVRKKMQTHPRVFFYLFSSSCRYCHLIVFCFPSSITVSISLTSSLFAILFSHSELFH